MKIRVASFLFALSIAVIAARALADPSWMMLPALIAGWYAADMMSGLIHMYLDYRPCTRGVGLDTLFYYEGARDAEPYVSMKREVMSRVGLFDRVVFDFKTHHPRPSALGRRSLEQQVGSTILLAALPFSLLLNAAALIWPLPGWLLAGSLPLIVGGTFAQYFHGSLHRADNPPLIHAMRRARLLITPEAHDLHHATLTRDFSTISGWSNPLLNKLFGALRARGRFSDEGLEPRG